MINERKIKKHIYAPKSIGRFAISSTLSAIVDVVLYALLYHHAFLTLSPTFHTLWAVLISRVVSSIVNYACNSKFVFKVTNSASVSKYYVLWFIQLCLSFAFAHITANILMLNPTISKALCDLLLGILSYSLQKKWVFKDSNNSSGPWVSLVRAFCKLFYPEYDVVSKGDHSPCVYVCHHMNMHGPIVTLMWLKSHPHPMILDCFFNYDTCYKHYRDFTFSVRFKRSKLCSRILSAFATIVTVPIIRSIHAIPVNRGGNGSLVTMRTSMEVLTKRHNIIVFPDKDYANRQGSNSNIYDGFLLLETLYHRKTGQHLAFVPLVVDDRHKMIIEKEAIFFRTKDFQQEKKDISSKISSAITA